MATEEVLDDIETGRFSVQVPIPMNDVIATVEWILTCSAYVDISEVNLRQRSALE